MAGMGFMVSTDAARPPNSSERLYGFLKAIFR
jgi:hypothetical protein